jgi:hypothetical protein
MMVDPDAAVNSELTITDDDRLIWNEELADFVPNRIFDAHVHLLDNRHLSAAENTFENWADTDFKTLQAGAEKLYPQREIHFLVLGTPLPGIDLRLHNDWIADQVRFDPQSRMNRLVTPACSMSEIERDHSKLGYIGLKPYRLFSSTGDPHQCRITDFLPHEQLEFANDHHLWVTMHLSRFHGCGDELNLADLHEFTTRRYPHVRWILAHCARSFTYWPIRQGIERLRDMPNIWYDVSAVTDVLPLITLFTKEDIKRVFFGSDAVDSTYFHGKYVTLGRAWQGLNADRIKLEFPHCDGRPILAIYEQLLAMKHAAELAGLSQSEIEDIFWRNAALAFDVTFDET